MPRCACLAMIVAAACGGQLDAEDVHDGPTIDGTDGPRDGAVDAAGDGAIDGPPPAPFSGTFTVVEVELMTPGMPSPIGQGLQARIVFTDGALVPAPLMEEQPGAPTGCKAWEYTAAQAAHAAVGIDEGPVTLTFSGGSSPATPPVVPPCGFAAGAGYRCADISTSGTGGAIAPGAGGRATLTDADTTFTATNALGRHIRIAGASSPANDGVFPILARMGTGAVVYQNPVAVAEVLPGAATHINLAGVGPIPDTVDPGFLADDVALSVTHVAGGAGHVPAFTLMTTAPAHLGDDVRLEGPSLALLNRIPVTGAELTFACATGCDAAGAELSQLDLITTDAPIAGLAPVAMPPPLTRQVRIRCAQTGPGPLRVPAAYSAKLMTAGATRIQATFVRGNQLAWPDPPVTGLVGHAIVTVTTP